MLITSVTFWTDNVDTFGNLAAEVGCTEVYAAAVYAKWSIWLSHSRGQSGFKMEPCQRCQLLLTRIFGKYNLVSKKICPSVSRLALIVPHQRVAIVVKPGNLMAIVSVSVTCNTLIKRCFPLRAHLANKSIDYLMTKMHKSFLKGSHFRGEAL
ncbi:hypothetical protein Plhal703r1_c27g0110581 [Plasmopara halstedii]